MKNLKLISTFVLLSFLAQNAWAGFNIGGSATLRVTGAEGIRASGSWTTTGTFVPGTGTVTFDGTTSTTLNAGSSSFYNLTLNKTSATDGNDNLTVGTNDLDVTNTTTITDGELIQGTTDFTLNGITVGANGKYSNASTGDLTLSSDVANAGTIDFDATGTSDSILIRSSVASTQRDWTGAGTFSMTDVDVKDQTANTATPPYIFVASGTNSNNNVNWLFGGGALTAVNVEPSSLVAGAESDVAVTFTLASDLPNDGKVVIDFGSGFNATGLATITNTSGIDGTWAIALSNGDGTNDVVTLTRQGDGTQTNSGVTVIITLEDEVKNPEITGSTGAYTVTTQITSGSVIDSGTATADTITAGVLSTLTVTPDQLYPGAVVDQTIAFTTANELPLDGKIVITYPEGFALDGTLTATSASDLDGTLAISVSEQVLTITRAAGSAFAGGGTVDDLIITGIRNPKAVGTTGTFTITTTNSSDVTIDSGTAVGVLIAGDDTLIKLSLTASPNRVRVGQAVTFQATITNMSQATLRDFNYIHSLPAGMVMKASTATVDKGNFGLISQGARAEFNEITAIDANETRIITYQAIVGSNAKPGEFANSAYCQINPVISNTSQLLLTIVPDALFDIGTLIGKVYWDVNANGVQDQGEAGLPNVELATEEGFVIQTDTYGRYSVQDFLTGRHMIKVNPYSLPAGAKFTTPESKIVNQTDAMLTKVNFGVSMPEGYADVLKGEASEEATVIVRQDGDNPTKELGLQFFDIEYDADTKIYSQIKADQYSIENGNKDLALKLPIKISSNYSHFVHAWKFDVLVEKANDPRSHLGKDLDSTKGKNWIEKELEVISTMEGEGVPPTQALKPDWHIFEDKYGLMREGYYVRVTLMDKEGNKDYALYYMSQQQSLDVTTWDLTAVQTGYDIPIRGTQVHLEGRTHAHKMVSLFDEELTTGAEGEFKFNVILPEGEYLLPVKIHKEKDMTPTIVYRSVRLRDSYLFFVGFTENEWGRRQLNGNVLQATEEERAQSLDKLYDESRIAYYLKGKIKGKYLITASVDTERTKKELFRNLEPEDYYGVYGDSSSVTKDADNTQDEYYVMIERDKSYFTYGNFDTGLTGTEFNDFNRTLHGSKLHYQSESIEPDGKPTQVLSAFFAKGRQRAAQNEFKTTGGSIYYLKHREITQGSEKITIQLRDKVTGITLQDKTLEPNVDYEVDYSEGRIRVFRPITTFSFGSNSFASTSILDGDLNYMIVDYEFNTQELVKDVTVGLRASQSLFDNALRIGATHVQEERPLERYELTGFDGHLSLPLNTLVEMEMGESKLMATEQYVSTDGGLNFSQVSLGDVSVDSGAVKIDVHSQPTTRMATHAYYRKIDRDFSSTSSLSEAGTEKFGAQLIHDMWGFGETHLRVDSEKLLDDGTVATIESTNVDTTTYLAQYFIKRGKWDGILEYRFSNGVDSEEELLTGEIEFKYDDKTTISIAGQKSLKEESNNKVTAKLIRKISDTLSIVLTQSMGSRGLGTLLGLQTNLLGKRYEYEKGFGSNYGLSTRPQLSTDVIKSDAQETEIGIDKKINDQTNIRASGSMSGKKTLNLSRKDVAGKDIEWIREEDEDVIAQTFSETEEINPNVTQYAQNTVTQDKLTDSRTMRRSQGLRALIFKDRGSVLVEEGFVDNGESINRDQSIGSEIYPNDKTTLNFSYQRNQEQTSLEDKDFHVGHFRFKYFDFGKLEIENTWELKMDDGPSDNFQLFSDGFIKANLKKEWSSLVRYEWSWVKSESDLVDLARFTEFQMSVAYRPIWNDRINLLAEYKYLTDEFPGDQISPLAGFSAHERFIYQAEAMIEINDYLTWVEKFAIRQEEVRVLNSEEESSKTFLHAHRLNLKVIKNMGLGVEYRVLSNTLSDDITQGFLVEADMKVMDSMSFAMGYNFSDFNSDISHDLDIEKEGFYFRLFYDPINALLNRNSKDPVKS